MQNDPYNLDISLFFFSNFDIYVPCERTKMIPGRVGPKRASIFNYKIPPIEERGNHK